MTGLARGVRRGAGRVGSGARGFWAGISAVGAKELRSRMRGRRAFVVVTVYLVLLALFAFGIYLYVKQRQAALPPALPGTGGRPGFVGPDGMPVDTAFLGQETALSSAIGQAIFSGLIVLETLLVLVLAPAFTTGAISLEREKQTLDMLVTTPLSTLGMIIGKLISALMYVFLLIVASIPMASVVFAFGGVGPEDLLRAYAMLFALAFGMGAIGLFVSALVRRTQTATVITFVLVLALTLGSAALHQFWLVASASPTTSTGFFTETKPRRAPEALLLLNPFVADADLICGTTSGFDDTCAYVARVTGKPYFGTTTQPRSCGAFSEPCSEEPIADAEGREGGVAIGRACPPGADCVVDGAIDAVAIEPDADPVTPPAPSSGFPRDTFWPKSAVSFLAVGALLTLLSAQLVSPTRRLRLRRPGLRRLLPSRSPRTPETRA